MTTKVNTSVLANTSVAGSAGNYGGSTKIPFFKVDDQGRLQTVGNTDPSIATSQLTGSIQANQLANNATFGINITGSAGTASSAGSVPASGLTGTQYSYVSTNRPGPTRLYRDDNDSAFNIRTFYNGSTNRWVLQGYNGDTLHNGVEVAYANTVKDGVVTSSTYSDPSWLTLTKSKVGLGNVDNTTDASKSVNYANTAGNGGVTSVNGNTGAVILSNAVDYGTVGDYVIAGSTAHMTGATATFHLSGEQVSGSTLIRANYTADILVSINAHSWNAMYISSGYYASLALSGTWELRSRVSGSVNGVGVGLWVRTA